MYYYVCRCHDSCVSYYCRIDDPSSVTKLIKALRGTDQRSIYCFKTANLEKAYRSLDNDITPDVAGDFVMFVRTYEVGSLIHVLTNPKDPYPVKFLKEIRNILDKPCQELDKYIIEREHAGINYFLILDDVNQIRRIIATKIDCNMFVKAIDCLLRSAHGIQFCKIDYTDALKLSKNPDSVSVLDDILQLDTIEFFKNNPPCHDLFLEKFMEEHKTPIQLSQ